MTQKEKMEAYIKENLNMFSNRELLIVIKMIDDNKTKCNADLKTFIETQ